MNEIDLLMISYHEHLQTIEISAFSQQGNPFSFWIPPDRHRSPDTF